MAIEAKVFNYHTDVVSQRQFDEHIKLYKGYVDKTNEITRELAEFKDRDKANATYSKYRGLKKGETYAIDGVILHEGYFSNMGGIKKTPGQKAEEVFNTYFGGYAYWKDDFIACCKAARGWAVLAYDQRTCSFRNILMDLHDDGVICMGYPVLVMDMYEHAYFLDYGTDKEKYIKKFIECINWDVVEKRLCKLK